MARRSRRVGFDHNRLNRVRGQECDKLTAPLHSARKPKKARFAVGPRALLQNLRESQDAAELGIAKQWEGCQQWMKKWELSQRCHIRIISNAL
jgi:hypothetical protein